MIGYFCDPFPEEALYSALARWCALLRCPNQKLAVQQLLGTANAQAVVDLPCHLDSLIAALPLQHGYTVDQLIDLHTLLPFYTPFSNAKRIRQLRKMMRGEGKAIHMSIGLMAGRVRPPVWLRSCPECDRQDATRYGEPYWHRLHQLAGVEVCPEHGVFLEDSTARRLTPRTRHVFHAARLTHRVNVARAINPSDCVHRMFLTLARDVAWLLTQSFDPPGQKAIYARYKIILAERGYTTGTGRVRWKQLRREFEAHYPEDFLHRVQCELSGTGQNNWLARLVRSPRAIQSPLRHLLLMQFIGRTAESFFQDVSQSGVFGTSPWPCLNRVCSSYRRRIIKKCSVEHSPERSQPIGAFACPSCGQIYCQVGSGRNAASHLTADWIREYGTLWLKKLAEWWKEPQLSLREIARRLGSDPMTIKRHAAKSGLPFPRTGKRLTHSCSKPLRAEDYKSIPSATTHSRRTCWLEAMAKTPALGVKRLRTQLPALYTQLYRHDRDWLRANQPARQPNPSPIKCRVNWQERDTQLVQLVSGAASRISESFHGKPQQITLPSIGKEMGHLALLEKHLKKLPLTAQAISAAMETRTGFALRRIGWAISKYHEERICPPLWRLVRRAGLRPELLREPVVAALLARSLRILGDNNCLTDCKLMLSSVKSAA